MAGFTPFVPLLAALFAGFALGLLVAFGLGLAKSRTARQIAQELLSESEARRRVEFDTAVANLKASFGDLSLDALRRSTEEFLKLAEGRLAAERALHGRELEAKKGEIAAQVERMTGQLDRVQALMRELETDRVQKFGELSGQLRLAGEQTAELTRTTGLLREALASSRARGQWGERMAEDVLRLAGFVEGINYLKQRRVEDGASRPDFTFPLPGGLVVHMDVKFPLDNYLRFLEAEGDGERARLRDAFLRDVKARIKEVCSRDYICPERDTVDYCLLFIPNERIYAFIHEHDPRLLDEGLRQKVVFCSPLTLYAVLVVIRQAVQNFALERTSNEILTLLGQFRRQWQRYTESMETLGRRLDAAQREFQALTTTRTRQLERPLDRLDQLRRDKGLPVAGGGEADPTEEGGEEEEEEEAVLQA